MNHGIADRLVAILVASVVVLGTAAGCGDSATEPPPPAPDPSRSTTVTVTPATSQLTALGATVQLNAEVRDQNGLAMAGTTLTWVSNATAIATVDGTGLVTAVGNGTATITASAGEASGTAIAVVMQSASSVSVSPAAGTIAVGDTLRLAAEAFDANGQRVEDAEFTWASGDTAVVTVDRSGLATGVGAGTAEITAAALRVAARAELTVVAPAPTTIAVSPDTTVFTALGETAQLDAEVRDQNGRTMVEAAVTWSSDAAAVASVNSAGLVTAVGNGTATITASVGEASGAATAVVVQSVSSVTVSPAAGRIAVGDTLRLAAEAFDANGQRVEDAEFTWASSDESVATVDASGLVRGIAESTTSITATAGSAQGTARITVASPHTTPPFRGTAHLDPDIIIPSDPTDFVDLEPAGRGNRFVYDRRRGWITVRAYLFDATFANGLFAEFQVNPEFGSWTEAEAAARAYAPAIGQIPFALREDMDAVWIHRGDEPFGGGNRALTVHTDRGEQYRQRGILPEIFVHEGVHTSLDSAHADAPGWLAAQAADPTFISTYARDYPGREDLAESFSAWLAVRHRRDRITEGMADTITSAIPHRLAYFDGLDLNLCPIVAGEACEARAQWTLSGTVSHGWSDPLASGLDTAMAGDIAGAVVEVIEGADAGRRLPTIAVATGWKPWRKGSSPFGQRRKGSRRQTGEWA